MGDSGLANMEILAEPARADRHCMRSSRRATIRRQSNHRKESFAMAVQSLQEFLAASKEKDLSADAFELENPHLLEVRVDGLVWAKSGAMVARKGGVKFTRQGMLEQG